MAWAFTHGDQARRSAYMSFFALPVLPAVVMRRATRRLLLRTGLPVDDADMYAERMSRPGAAQASLNWYRVALPLRRTVSERLGRRGSTSARSERPPKDASSVVPTTYVWGRLDPALGRDAAERTTVVMSKAAERAGLDLDTVYRFVELPAGHWLPETRPAEVVAAILDRVRSTG
jgi:pimeloyl-ACP methyl ester carboxylesterase